VFFLDLAYIIWLPFSRPPPYHMISLPVFPYLDLGVSSWSFIPKYLARVDGQTMMDTLLVRWTHYINKEIQIRRFVRMPVIRIWFIANFWRLSLETLNFDQSFISWIYPRICVTMQKMRYLKVF
jgi:hypothetical protein